MKIAINEKIDYKPKSDDSAAYWSLAHEFKNVDISAEDLAIHIAKGYSFCAQHSSVRKSNNFTESGYLAVDIDNGMTLKEVLENTWVQNYASLVYATWNHTEDHNRFRIVFELARTIKDQDEMRYALIGGIRKFGGDEACKDVCRMFYGNKGGEQFFIGKVLPNEVLQELIELGQTQKVSAEYKSDHTSAPTVNRSSRHLDKFHMVKTASGNFDEIEKLSRSTRVHCPFHIDKNPSAFVILSKNNTNGIHCAKCNESFWPKTFSLRHLQEFDFYQIDSLLNAVEYHEDPYNNFDEDAPPEFFTNHDRVVQPGSDKRLADIELIPGITLVRSPKGSGKSYQLAKVVKKCKSVQQSVLLIGHRQSLLSALAQTLGLDCYLDRKDNEGVDIPVSKYYAICLDSIPHRLDLNVHKFDVVIIDESEQVFSHITSDTLKAKRRKCFLKMQQYLKNAKTLIACDADLSQLTLSVVSNARNGEQPSRFYVNRHKQIQKNIEVYNSENHLMTELIEAVNAGGKYYVTSNSKTKAEQIATVLSNSVYRDIKIQLITKDNSQDKDVRYFIDNIKTEILEYDVVVSSPSLGTGIDITFPDDAVLIDGVFGFFSARVNTHFDIDQQICRVRHPGFVKVWLSFEKFLFEIEPDSIKRNLVENGEFTDFLVGYDSKNYEVHNMDDSLLTLHAEVISLSRASKNNLRKHFIDLKKYNGWNVAEVETNDEKTDVGKKALKESKRRMEEIRIQAICKAEKLTEVEVKKLMDATIKTGASIAKVTRYWIEWFYDEEVTPELVMLDDGGSYQDKVKMMMVYLGAADKSIAHDQPQMKNFSCDRDFFYAKKDLLRSLFSAAKLTDSNGDFVEDKVVCAEELGEFVRVCRASRGQIETLLKMEVRGDLENKPTTQLNNLLKIVGCFWGKAINCDVKGKRVRYYGIDKTSLQTVKKYAKMRLEKKT